MFGTIGMQELIIIFVIALIIFGPRRLPELGKSLGKSIAEFKRASNELRNTLEEEIRVDEQRQTQAAAGPDASPAGRPPVPASASPSPRRSGAVAPAEPRPPRRPPSRQLRHRRPTPRFSTADGAPAVSPLFRRPVVRRLRRLGRAQRPRAAARR